MNAQTSDRYLPTGEELRRWVRYIQAREHVEGFQAAMIYKAIALYEQEG